MTKRMLVATDFGASSDAALTHALTLAKALQASVHLLHVVETPIAAGMWASEIYTAQIAGLQINLVRDAEQQLRSVLRSLDACGVKISGEVRTGAAAEGITDVARDGEFQLIVMGTHGRTGVARMMIGSVAERVARTAPCPVLIVPIEKHAAAMPRAS